MHCSTGNIAVIFYESINGVLLLKVVNASLCWTPETYNIVNLTLPQLKKV